MVKIKDYENKQVNVMLSGLEYNALVLLGGATSVLKTHIEDKAGDIFKLKRLRQQIIDNIEKEQQRLRETDKLIKEHEEKEAEEKKKRAEELIKKTKHAVEKPTNKKQLSDEEWVLQWKPEFQQRLKEHGELSELEYKAIDERLGFSKEEADNWLREGNIRTPPNNHGN